MIQWHKGLPAKLCPGLQLSKEMRKSSVRHQFTGASPAAEDVAAAPEVGELGALEAAQAAPVWHLRT